MMLPGPSPQYHEVYLTILVVINGRGANLCLIVQHATV